MVRTAVAAGIDACFCNPGTTEMTLIAALEDATQVRIVLGLVEGVVAGAADGYARIAEKPALTLTHQGIGFSSALANLHNARRARSPVVNLVGGQPRWHEALDSNTNTDTEAIARAASAWVRRAQSASTLAGDLAEAITAAGGLPGQIATLLIPADCQWGPAAEPVVPVERAAPPRPDEAAIAAAARALAGKGQRALLLGGTALHGRGLAAAHRIAASTGCRLIGETFPAKLAAGRGAPPLERLPYFPEIARSALRHLSAVVLAGASKPVSFFGYRDGIGPLLVDPVQVVTLAEPTEDAGAALEELAARTATGVAPAPFGAIAEEPPVQGPLTPRTLSLVLARQLPEDAILVDEGVSSSSGQASFFAASVPHTYLSLTGGACGLAPSCAVGAALAAPGRRVVTLVGDGSAMYNLPALWTQAHEGLDIVNVVCANRGYRILQAEYQHVNERAAGPRACRLFDLADPEFDWVSLARGVGVPGRSVFTAEELTDALRRACAEPGPALIEARL